MIGILSWFVSEIMFVMSVLCELFLFIVVMNEWLSLSVLMGRLVSEVSDEKLVLKLLIVICMLSVCSVLNILVIVVMFLISIDLVSLSVSCFGFRLVCVRMLVICVVKLVVCSWMVEMLIDMCSGSGVMLV